MWEQLWKLQQQQVHVCTLTDVFCAVLCCALCCVLCLQCIKW